MSFFRDLFTYQWPHNYPAELKAMNIKIAAKPGNMADYDKRSDIHFRLGNAQAAIMDFETAGKLEPELADRDLRAIELREMRKQYS